MESLMSQNLNPKAPDRHEFLIAKAMLKIATAFVSICALLIYFSTPAGQIIIHKTLDHTGMISQSQNSTLAENCFQAEDFQCSLKALKKFKKPDSKQMTMLAASHRELGNLKQATQLFYKAVFYNKSVHLVPAQQLAQIYLMQGRFKSARRLIFRVHRKTKNSGLLLKELGMANQRKRYIVAKK